MGTMAQIQTILSGCGEWWEGHVKTHLKRLIRREEAKRNKNHIMENHLYECLYDILRGETPETDKYYTLQRYKAKIVNLHTKKKRKSCWTHAHTIRWKKEIQPSIMWCNRDAVMNFGRSGKYKTPMKRRTQAQQT
jgi:hypothetical protein